MELSTGQAVDDANVQKRRTHEEQILELLSDAPPPQSNTLSETGNENVRPMPPAFQRSLRQSLELNKVTEHYFLNLGRGDSHRVPGEGGRKSLLANVLTEDAAKAKKTRGWEQARQLFGRNLNVRLWEKAREQGPVWLPHSIHD